MTDFKWDFIPLLPLQLFTFKNKRENLFFLIKLLRIRKGMKMLDVTMLKFYIKAGLINRMERKIESDVHFANNMIEPMNPVESLMFSGYMLKSLQLTIILVNISYIMGMLFFILCEAVQDYHYDVNYQEMAEEDIENFEPENFIQYFQLYSKTAGENSVIMTYYMFTSLSTVGFGDYHPRSNLERLVVSIILLFGVAI